MEYSPSVACARQINIEADVRELLAGGMKLLHVDFMDGHNVPNLCLNFDTVRELHEQFGGEMELDAHLMVTDPENYVDRCAAVGVKYLSFDPFAAADPKALLRRIRAKGMIPGIAVNPKRELSEFDGLLPLCGMVIVMSITPGVYGVPFMPETYDRIAYFDAQRREKGYDYLISIDGGVTPDNGRRSRGCGADVLVLGVFTVFRQGKPISQACREFIENMQK